MVEQSLDESVSNGVLRDIAVRTVHRIECPSHGEGKVCTLKLRIASGQPIPLSNAVLRSPKMCASWLLDIVAMFTPFRNACSISHLQWHLAVSPCTSRTVQDDDYHLLFSAFSLL